MLVPQNGWFMMLMKENNKILLENRWFGGSPILGNHRKPLFLEGNPTVFPGNKKCWTPGFQLLYIFSGEIAHVYGMFMHKSCRKITIHHSSRLPMKIHETSPSFRLKLKNPTMFTIAIPRAMFRPARRASRRLGRARRRRAWWPWTPPARPPCRRAAAPQNPGNHGGP